MAGHRVVRQLNCLLVFPLLCWFLWMSQARHSSVELQLVPFSTPWDNKESLVSGTDQLFHIILNYTTDLPLGSLCSIESLSRKISPHENATKIWLWMANEDLFPERIRELARHNVVVKKIDFDRIIADSPLERLYHNSNASLGRWATQNKANAMRLAIVHKYGGTYMDSDFVVLNDPTVLKNGCAFQDANGTVFNNAVFRFDDASEFTKQLMLDFVDNYNGNKWGHNGPALFTRVFANQNSTSTPCYRNESRIYCTGSEMPAEVWPTNLVYAIPYQDCGVLFNTSGFDLARIEPEPILLHLWHNLSKQDEKKACRKGKLEKYQATLGGYLRSVHCPVATEMLLQDCRHRK